MNTKFTRAIMWCPAAAAMLVCCACSDQNRSPLSPSPVATPPAPANATGCSVSGVVHESPSGAVSVGAIVKIVKEPGGFSASPIASATTDASGGYRLNGLDCGVSRLLRVEKADFFSQEMSVLIDANIRRDLTIDRITYPLRGIVRDASNGTALAAAIVEVVRGAYVGLRTTTFSDGSYALSVRDAVTVRVTKPGYVSQEAAVTVIFPEANRDFGLAPAQ